MLLDVKGNLEWAASNPKLGLSNMLGGVEKKPAAEILAENLERLMNQHPDRSSGPTLAKKSKVAQKTISNVLAGRHDTQLSTIVRLAKAFGLEAYQLLAPASEEALLRIVYAYNSGGPGERRLLLLAAETALQNERPADDTRTSDSGGTRAPRSVS